MGKVKNFSGKGFVKKEKDAMLKQIGTDIRLPLIICSLRKLDTIHGTAGNMSIWIF